MQNEIFVKEFVNTGSIDTFLSWIRYLKANGYYHLVVLLCELVYPMFSYNVDFLDELGMCYYYCGHYQQSWNTYMDILSSSMLTEERQKAYFFNAHFSIPHIMTNPKTIVYPDQHTIHQIHYNTQAIPLVTFSITTCKRYDLFERTMNSFIHHCEDIDLITHWLCVDDNSSDEDRLKMKKNYPFFDFVWKTPSEKGHAQSMNMILQKVTTPFLFHMEDDWQFFNRAPYIKQCLEILNEGSSFGQCLINKNYAETFEDISIIGGQFNTTKFGLRYYIHEHQADGALFAQKYGNGPNSAYWAHYSLRPGLNSVSILREVGLYNPNANHFEMDFAYRYMNKGYKTTFLDAISCTHIGRLTSERGDDTKINAYTLNNELQFVPKNSAHDSAAIASVVAENTNKIECKCIVINMDSRSDRLSVLETEITKRKVEDGEFFDMTRFPAIDGYNLKPSRQLEQLFNPNDYNYRRGMIGCALSHIAIWTHLVNNPSIYLVLEDDVTFAPYFTLKVKNLFDQLNDTKWDIVFLGHHLYSKYKTNDSYHKHKMPSLEKWSTNRSLTESIGGTGGYIINHVGALKMLSFIQQHGMINGIDTMMQKACDTLDVYYCTPHLIYSECYSVENMSTADTDIQRNYDSMKRDIQERLQDEIVFLRSNGATNIVSCNPTNKIDHSENCEAVVVCFNECDHHDDGIRYAIEHVHVYIPSDLVQQHPILGDIGLLVDGKLSIQKIIQYKD